MTDCGASGSALDRALSSLVTPNQSNQVTEAFGKVTKAVSGMVGGIGLKSFATSTVVDGNSISVATPVEIHINSPISSLPIIQQMSHQWPQVSTNHTNSGSPYSLMPQSMAHTTNMNHEYILRQQILNDMIQKNISMMDAFKFTPTNSLVDSKHQLPQETAEYHANGSARDVTIEELMAAWQDAESEYLSTNEYDLSNLAELYNEEKDLTQAETSLSYEFSENSRYYSFSPISNSEIISDRQVTHQNPNLMERGIQLFDEGEIQEAILCFESHLQNVDPDDCDAWLMLGKCHAESDEDRKAIVCLERSIEKNQNSSAALIALCVSYVNELLHERALLHLKSWISCHPKYSNIVNISQSNEGSAETLALDELKNLLKLALNASTDEPHSADILEALGILCNVSREYEDAANYFRAAIHHKGDDHQLWNKLGATLANSNHSDEALHAYREALSLKPKYARAWLNMAIAHSNLQNHEEAARCYLQTLSLNSLATHVWNYLRITFTALERWDLMPLIAARDIQSFHNFFDFVDFARNR